LWKFTYVYILYPKKKMFLPTCGSSNHIFTMGWICFDSKWFLYVCFCLKRKYNIFLTPTLICAKSYTFIHTWMLWKINVYHKFYFNLIINKTFITCANETFEWCNMFNVQAWISKVSSNLKGPCACLNMVLANFRIQG